MSSTLVNELSDAAWSQLALAAGGGLVVASLLRGRSSQQSSPQRPTTTEEEEELIQPTDSPCCSPHNAQCSPTPKSPHTACPMSSPVPFPWDAVKEACLSTVATAAPSPPLSPNANTCSSPPVESRSASVRSTSTRQRGTPSASPWRSAGSVGHVVGELCIRVTPDMASAPFKYPYYPSPSPACGLTMLARHHRPQVSHLAIYPVCSEETIGQGHTFSFGSILQRHEVVGGLHAQVKAVNRVLERVQAENAALRASLVELQGQVDAGEDQQALWRDSAQREGQLRVDVEQSRAFLEEELHQLKQQLQRQECHIHDLTQLLEKAQSTSYGSHMSLSNEHWVSSSS